MPQSNDKPLFAFGAQFQLGMATGVFLTAVLFVSWWWLTTRQMLKRATLQNYGAIVGYDFPVAPDSEWLAKSGTFDWFFPIKSVYFKEINDNDNLIYDSAIDEVSRAPAVDRLSFDRVCLTEKALANLRHCKTVRSLLVRLRCPMSAEFASAVGQMSSLESLRLVDPQSDMSSDFVRGLFASKKILELRLTRCNITTDGWDSFVKECGGLQTLELDFMEIDIEAARFISEVKCLKKLDLGYCDISGESLALIQKALPRCQVDIRGSLAEFRAWENSAISR